MDVNTQESTREDQKKELTPRERLAFRFRQMDERLKDPTLTLDERYEIASPLIGLFE